MNAFKLKLLGFAVFGIVAIALFMAPAPSGPELADPSTAIHSVPPGVLVDWILTDREVVQLVDTRSEASFLENGIRGAVSLPLDAISSKRAAALPKGHMLVVYGESGGDGEEAFQRLIAFRDDVIVLEGGYRAWTDQILEPSKPEADAAKSEWSIYAERMAISNFLLGKSDSAPLPERSVVAPVLRPRSKLANEGC